MKKISSEDRIIGEFATRKIGNSLVLTVPVSTDIADDTKFVLRPQKRRHA